MANITLLGASYTDVPAVTLPQTGGGTVTFYENGGGGSGYTRTVIAPQQTVTPTYSDGQTIATLSTASGTLVEGDNYIITLDGDEYWFTAINVDWGGFTFIGAEGYLWGTSGEQLYPCLIYDGPSEYNNLMLLVYDGSAGTPVTIKVEKIELS